jgi:hypothetical protein
VLWGTGLGADASSDLTGGTSGDQTGAANVRVIVGGIEVTPIYAGRSSGSPGLDQINMVLPSNVQLSCFVPVQVRAGGRLSNQGFISTAASGQNACSSSTLSPAQLSKLDAGGTVTVGAISLVKQRLAMNFLGQNMNIDTESAGASFARMTIADVSNSEYALTQVGSCFVFRRTGTQDQVTGGATGVLLDAGARLTLNGPGASNVAMNKDANSYNATLYSSGFGGFGGSGQPTIVAGTYSVAGTGGADVGAFNTSIAVPGTFTWTNQANLPDSIPRSSNLTITWTGGGEGLVSITGISGSTLAGGSTENPIIDAGVFACTAPASAGNFSVPSSVLQQLPAIAATSETGIGMLLVNAIPDPSKNQGVFTAPLTAGGSIDWGFISYSIGAAKSTGWN